MEAKSNIPQGLEPSAARAFVDAVWEREILPTITEYIRIPNKSPAFDKDWKKNGHMDRAADLIERWCRARKVPGLRLERVELPGRTPLLYMEIPARGKGSGGERDTVLLYGHLDKQPEMAGWRDGLGPWTPVRDGDRLYGRGGADDGYAAFASLTALQLLAEQGLPHARCVVLIEGCEESGSFDLPHYIDHLKDRIGGDVSLVVCLDSGCGDYERLWSTTSLRGMAGGELRVDILREGVHSGDASGIVPDSFRILRSVLSRIEDEHSGRVLLKELHVKIPKQRADQAKAVAKIVGKKVHSKFPFVGGAKPVATELTELILNRTWRPTVTVTGADGLPTIGNAGNVLRPYTSAKVSIRLPPSADGKKCEAVVKRVLEKSPPYGCKVTYKAADGCTGWDAPPLAPWLERAVGAASATYFGKPAAYMGEGGTIPFMGMLGEKFPRAQFLITGVLGPESNAHGPNEFLHVPTAKKLTACVADVVHQHLGRSNGR
jgi:acetylornithine deacetylase/succinyl-diaminopimelate desuccinylase-like protein